MPNYNKCDNYLSALVSGGIVAAEKEKSKSGIEKTAYILIDADGCPVVDITIRIAKANHLECIILCDTSHYFKREGATTITVPKGADGVDFALVNKLYAGDIVITQDYGLAAMCLARGAVPISQDGMIYSDANIGSLLEQRHMAKKIRRGGGRLSGPTKRTDEQNAEFVQALRELLENQEEG